MAWIVSQQDLARHPKLKRAARALGVGAPTLIGHLHLLWWWALDYGGEDGDLSRYDAADIAEAAMWEGDPQAFVDALADCGPRSSSGFLDRTESGGVAIHDWDEYMGPLLERRRKSAQRQSRYRERQREQAQPEPVTPQSNRVTSYVTVTSRSSNGSTDRTDRTDRTERETRARDHDHAREGTAPPAPVSLSLVEASPQPEQEADPTPTPIRDPAAEREQERIRFEAWADAVGMHPATATEKRAWVKGLRELVESAGLSPPGFPGIVAQYRALKGADRKPSPGQVAAIYSQLGVSPHVLHEVRRQPPPSDPDAALRRAREGRAALVALGVSVPYKPDIDDLGSPNGSR